MLTKFLVSIFTLTLVLLSSPAGADDRDGRSEDNRVDKKFTAHAILVAVGPSLGFSNGASVGMFIDHNSLVDLEYVSGRPENWYGSFFTDYEIETKSFGVHYKKFVSNTFYFRIGADYRQIDYRHTYRNFLTSATYSENKFSGDSIAGTIVIGNQWQFENFTLGCDWFGVAVPISSNIKSESSTGTKPDPNGLKDDEDRYVKDTMVMAVRFYLGASF